MKLIKKMRGGHADLPPRPTIRVILLSGIGAAMAISILGLLQERENVAWILGSFGASCVFVFGLPESPISQPRSVIGGHFLCSLIGLTFIHCLGAHWWSLAPALGLAIVLMFLTRTVHAPAASNPVIIYLMQPGWDFLWLPTLLGSLTIIFLGLIYNNLTHPGCYPTYWLGHSSGDKARDRAQTP